MNIIRYFNKRIKLFKIWDLKLAQLASLLLMWIVIKLFPSLLQVGFVYLIIPLVIVVVRLFYVVFIKKIK